MTNEVFRKTTREAHQADTVIESGGVRIGGGNFAMIAGPCSVETEDQIVSIARAVKKAGANILRGGAYTSRHDHRMVMALKVAELGADGAVTIDDTDCVSKSYPDFLRSF